ncbi:RNA polymerase sigma-70 factor, ECF subfamily [Asanoa hainanensis]|uniref:RNA polymerase sigma-70 factor, ECF subfamily n=1 Tax=Asanoa hainanensis TaxID=560556 RepID=A0A239PGS2_9ACTN|nr:sigma-70 family RNA polymerase sigma factor [Asanoa hainanensis]SNT65798.1 RNA polymerase sigma-70 factor, ECF subfamily [Asanoa hainanensis]
MGVGVHTDLGQTDSEIIGRMHTDPESFGTIFDRYYPAIHGYVNRRLGQDLADDVAAETFLVAFDRWRRFDTAYESARPWLFGIASNLVAGHQRTEARRYRALARADQVDAVDGPAERVAVRLDAQAVRGRLATALEQITPPDREVLLLIAWGDLTSEEVAHALEIPAGTVRSRLHRARTKVRAALGGVDPTATKEDLR